MSVLPGVGWSPPRRYQSTKPRMPAWTIIETHDRSSALSSRNQAMSCSMRAVAAVLSAPGRPLQGVSGPPVRDRAGSGGHAATLVPARIDVKPRLTSGKRLSPNPGYV